MIWVFGSVGAPNTWFIISRLPVLRLRSPKACRTLLWSLWTYLYLQFLSRPFVTIKYNTGVTPPVTWYDVMIMSLAPLGPQTLDLLYPGFPSSDLGHPKNGGPSYGLFRHLCLISWPSVIIQYQCDASRVVLWCHGLGPTAPLGC